MLPGYYQMSFAASVKYNTKFPAFVLSFCLTFFMVIW